MSISLGDSPVHYHRWEILRDLLYDLAEGKPVLGAGDMYNHLEPGLKMTSTGVRMVGFLGMAAAVDLVEREETGNNKPLWVIRENVLQYNNQGIGPFEHWITPTVNDLIYLQSAYYGIHPVQFQVIGGCINSFDAIKQLIPSNIKPIDPDQYWPMYVIPAHWNGNRVDIVTTPIGPKVIADNIDAMLNWVTTGELKMSLHAGWRFYHMN